MLWGQLTDNINRFSIRADQVTNLNIDTVQNTSLNTFLKTISEFSQFLSIALFAEQHPSEVIFANKGERFKYQLLFKTNPSSEPFVQSLIMTEKINDTEHVAQKQTGHQDSPGDPEIMDVQSHNPVPAAFGV